MDTFNILKQLVDDYIVFAIELRKKHNNLLSLFGPRTEEIYHPGHEAFDNAVENWCRDFAASQPDPEEVDAALELLLFDAEKQDGKAPYWYLIAVQRHSLMLIPLLDEARKSALAQRFADQYPPRLQVPVQVQVYQALNPHASRRKFRLFGNT